MSREIPPWLEQLLKTRFFAACRSHLDAPRNECNMFCLDCNGNDAPVPAAAAAFCFYCHSSRHHDHRVVQIRRSSYHDVVRVGEMQKVIDVSGVQTYVINSARVIFLNQRPQPKSSSSSSQTQDNNLSSYINKGGGPGGASSNHHHHHVCEICGRSLLDTLRFCSLGCKLAGVRRNGGNTSFELGQTTNEDGDQHQPQQQQGIITDHPQGALRRGGAHHRSSRPSPQGASPSTKRRKGPDPTLTNDGLRPAKPAKRTLSDWEMASLWVGLVVGVPSYDLAGSLVNLGMALVAGNRDHDAPGAARAGRSAFRVKGAHVPTLLRALVG
ncbi:hypothetical protein MLD38_020357 [Melastoma candidum]|uniref:Uncharacterized protein n=1 Tax=Melastoma candidum TaxID=119954 RepID=A0ACB9QD58_9MYRT|nr:hypothetical protein MLD38_020357 [Melastoma candidum]